jgi:ABC-type Na+ efflux pump permease subunit
LSYLRECNIRVRAFATEAEAEAAYQRRMLDAIVVLPADDGAAMEMRLILPAAETQATVILMVLKEPLSRFENALRAARGVPLHYATLRATPSTTYEFLYATILPILMFFPAFVAGSMVVDSISEEVQQHTLDTLWAAPVSLNAILGAKIAAALLLAVVQLLLWVGLLRLNRIAIANLPWVLLFALLIAALNAVLAAFVATLFKDRERSQFAYSLLIVILVGASQLLSLPPVAVLTRLAIADAYTGPLNVVAYGLALAALWAVYHVLARRMLATSL